MDRHKKFTYRCTDCGAHYDTTRIMYLCPVCEKENRADLPPKGVLKIEYDYESLKQRNVRFETLKNRNFIDLLPIESLKSLPPLRVGKTPLYKIKETGGNFYYLKDDGQNPTYSFKDRASALVSAFAKEHGIDRIVAASTGNAGSSLAGICASQHQKAVIMVPAAAPIAKLTQIVMYGARIVPVAGTYDDAFDLSLLATGEFNWYNRNTAYNPLTIEGKKTVAFELFDDLDETLPDRIFVPVGDGVIISGVYKGFEDLMRLGIIDKMPEIIAVQAKGSDNLVRNFLSGSFKAVSGQTVADSIAVDIPRNFNMAVQFLADYNGKTVTVTDSEILEASRKLASTTGIFSEPAAAAAFAGFQKFKQTGSIEPEEKNIILLTGSGLKDVSAVSSLITLPDPVKPDIQSLKKFLS